MNCVDPSCFYNIMKNVLPLHLKRLFKNRYFILNNIHLGPIAAFHGVTLVLLRSSVFYFNLLPLLCFVFFTELEEALKRSLLEF